MNKFTLATAIFQVIGGLALVGISVYYYFAANMVSFGIFLGVGILFILMPIRTFYKAFASKKEDDDDKKNDGGGKGFL